MARRSAESDGVSKSGTIGLRRSDRFLAGLHAADRVVFVSHVQPDPDSLGSMLGLAHLVAAATLAACTVLNTLGINVAVRFNQAIGAVFILVLAVLAFGPFLTGDFNAASLTSHLDGGWKALLVWFYVSAYAVLLGADAGGER